MNKQTYKKDKLLSELKGLKHHINLGNYGMHGVDRLVIVQLIDLLIDCVLLIEYERELV